MRLLLDCDVLLDVALGREPFYESSAAVLDWAERNPGRASVAWHSLANLQYLCPGGAREFIGDLLRFTDVPPVSTDAMHRALALPMTDLEDAMQVAAADAFGAQILTTRNVTDFAASPVKAMQPSDLVPLLYG